MPSNFISFDELPTFTGKETVPEQLQALRNYLFVMRQQLQYILNNLSISNWNPTALKTLTDDTQKAFVETLEQVNKQLKQMKISVDSLSGRVSGMDNLSERMDTAEADIAVVTAWAAEHEQNTADLPQRMQAAEEQIGLLQAAEEEQDGRLLALEEALAEDEANLGELDTQVSGMNLVLQSLQETVEALCQIVQKSDSGAVIGEEGKDLNLVGNIYINGVLYTQEGESV